MTHTFILHLLLLASGPIVAPADAPTNVGVRDNGNFFSPEARRTATATLDEIARLHHDKEVLIETYNDVPGGQGLRAFAVEHARAAKLNGLYVVIVRKGGQVGVLPDNEMRRVFTEPVTTALRDLIMNGLRKGPKNFDQTLLDAVASIKTTLEGAERPAGSTSRPATGPAGATAGTRPAGSRTDQILDALASEVPELRKAAADALRASAADRAVAEPAVPRLLALLKGGDAGVRPLAADLLGDIGKAQPDLIAPAVPALIEALRDNSSNDVRRAAARALGRAGATARNAATGPLKAAAANDADARVREEAASSLRALGSEKP